MNFHAYLDRQKTEDRRAFIIHFPAKSGKTQFARRVREIRADVYLLDLQAYVARQSGLPPIHQFNFPVLRRLLLSLEVPQAVIIVDNPDFLLNTWSPEEKRSLLHWVRVGLRSPADTAKTFVFVAQDDDVFAAEEFRNAYGEPRVVPLNAFESV